MKTPRLFPVLLLLFFSVACKKFPGQPDPSERWQSPQSITDFQKLYAMNCAACHAIRSGQVAAALPLNDPDYLRFAGRETIRGIIANGVPGHAMPAFSLTNGGELAEAQIVALADGIYHSAGKLSERDKNLPAYAAPNGNATAGHAAFGIFCAQCHGNEGLGQGKIGSIVDPNYLSLVSDQSLRTLIVVGRPDVRHPNFSHDLPDRAMTSTEIADVVAWLGSQRPAEKPSTDLVSP